MNSSFEKILVLEDDLPFQKVLKHWLSNAGFQVTIAATAVDALYRARKQQFDLVISDYCLPDYLGTDFLKLLREIHSYECIPAILVTARADELDKQWLRRELKILVLPKPCNMALLCDTVGKCLSIARGSDLSELSHLD
ncbi:MAG: response regulator [Pirellulaceae bacterium]|jgi:DNA-binding response OmpR family regulator|nr:response regulator [Pirellulaceae bacterium]